MSGNRGAPVCVQSCCSEDFAIYLISQHKLSVCSANRGDSLDRNIDAENRQTKDFLILVSYDLLLCS